MTEKIWHFLFIINFFKTQNNIFWLIFKGEVTIRYTVDIFHEGFFNIITLILLKEHTYKMTILPN